MAEDVAATPVAAAPEVAVVSSVAEAATSANTPIETPIAPVVEAAPAVEAAPIVAEPAVDAPKPLLNVEDAKPAEADKAADAPKEVVEAAPLPVYEFKLPEGVDTNNPQFKAFNAKLGEFQNLSKTEQAAVQKFGQEMIDMHTSEIKAIVENQNKSAWDWFNNRNKEWLETSKKDPSIGGEAWNETLSDASRAISLYGGTKAQQLETAKLFQDTGVENNTALLRFLSNITRNAAKEGQPVSAQPAPAQKAGIAQAMYGKTSA